MIALAILALAAGMALLTWSVAWWAPLVAAFIVGAVWRHHRSAALTALAAFLGWGGLLAFDARSGRMGVLVTLLGGVFSVSGVVLAGVTLCFAAIGAWSAATVGSEAVRLLRRP